MVTYPLNENTERDFIAELSYLFYTPLTSTVAQEKQATTKQRLAPRSVHRRISSIDLNSTGGVKNVQKRLKNGFSGIRNELGIVFSNEPGFIHELMMDEKELNMW